MNIRSVIAIIIGAAISSYSQTCHDLDSINVCLLNQNYDQILNLLEDPVDSNSDVNSYGCEQERIIIEETVAVLKDANRTPIADIEMMINQLMPRIAGYNKEVVGERAMECFSQISQLLERGEPLQAFQIFHIGRFWHRLQLLEEALIAFDKYDLACEYFDQKLILIADSLMQAVLPHLSANPYLQEERNDILILKDKIQDRLVSAQVQEMLEDQSDPIRWRQGIGMSMQGHYYPGFISTTDPVFYRYRHLGALAETIDSVEPVRFKDNIGVGVSIHYERFLSPRWRSGLTIAYGTLQVKILEYVWGTANLLSTIETRSIQFRTDYILNKGSRLMPFVGVGAGYIAIRRNEWGIAVKDFLSMGEYVFHAKEKNGFILTLALGVDFAPFRNTHLLYRFYLSATHSAAAKELVGGNMFSLGLAVGFYSHRKN